MLIRKTAAGIPAAIQTTAAGMLPRPSKKQRPRGRSARGRSKSDGHGADARPWPLRLWVLAQQHEHQRIRQIKDSTTDGYATDRTITHPPQSNTGTRAAKLPTALLDHPRSLLQAL